jgi:CRP/FNR family cyclic AMP-dependent transcriptional regulator
VGAATAGQPSPDAVTAALGASGVLHLLSERARARLAAAGSLLALEPGGYLCQAGDPGDAVYVVIAGEIEVLNRTEGGKTVRLFAHGPGALVGEMAALDGGKRSADMAATRRCRLWRIPRQALIDAFEAEPKAAVALVAELSGRLRAANAALEASAVLDLGGRLARLLIQAKGARGLIPLTQTELARRLGASREKVNRKLHAWAADGWVELTPSGVRLVETDALAALIERARRR